MREHFCDIRFFMTYVVYEHWRPDTDVCFYVGKGKMRRARTFEARNDRHGKIVAKLRRMGLQPELRIVASDLTAYGAIAMEIEQIALRRAEGVDLANYTDGGDGSPGCLKSAETRAKIAAKATGRIASAETRAKMSAARTGQKRSEATRAKQSAAAKMVQGDRRRKECADPAERERMAILARNIASDPAMRARRAANAKALWQDPEYRARVMAAREKSRCAL